MAETKRQAKLEQWIDEYRAIVYKVVRSYARSHHDRQDLFQEVVTQLWKAIPRFEGRSKESTFIYRVALFAAMSWSRSERRREDVVERVGEDNPLFIDQGSSDSRLNWLYERIAELEEVDRSLTLLMLDGFSYREIAEMMGYSESNVGVKLTRIRKKLTKLLSEDQDYEL